MMTSMKRVALLFLTFFVVFNVRAQDIIWSEYFDVYPNNTMVGPGLTEDTYKWKVPSGSRQSNSASVQDGEMRIQFSYSVGNGNSINTAEIDISNYQNVSVSVQYSGTASSPYSQPSASFYFHINGTIDASKTQTVNGTANQTVTVTGINGNTLKVTCAANLGTGATANRVYFDDIIIRGQYQGTEETSTGDGGLTAQFWEGIGSVNLSSLTGNSNYPDNPTSSQRLTEFNAPRDRGDTFGGRLKGYIIPPKTGFYNFFIASDDHSEFRISSDETSTNLPSNADANVDNWSTYQNYWDEDCSHSDNKFLVKGRYYYFEGIYKENYGGDHLTIAWLKPGSSALEIVPSSALSEFLPVEVILAGTNLNCYNGSDGSITATVTGGQPPYEYKVDGGTYQSGNTLSGLSAGSHTVTVRDARLTEESESITLTQPTAISITLTAQKPDCGNCNGTARVQVSGGTPSYQFAWSGGNITGDKTKKMITFQGNEAATNYQLELTVAYESNMQADFDDLRFYDTSNNSLSYWIEYYTASSSANVWVKIPSVSVGENKIIMRYGDSNASSESNINNVMVSGGLNVEYYNNRYLSGSFTRCVDNQVLNYSYGGGSRVNIGNCGTGQYDNVSVRWTGWLNKPLSNNTMYFNIQTDDGARLYIDNMSSPKINRWYDQSPTYHHVSYTFSRSIVRIKYEFYENGGNAYARLGYSSSYTSGIGAIVPSGNYYYRNIINNPPTNIVFGEETGDDFIKEGMCQGSHTLTVTDGNACTQSASVTIAQQVVNLTLDGFDGCARVAGSPDEVKAVATQTGGTGTYRYQFLFDGNIIQAFGTSNECEITDLLGVGSHVVRVVMQDISVNNCEVENTMNITIHGNITTNAIVLE
ncbi:DUF2341 domain-containing protein [Prolixibacteraceae bacterium JC049]|nr:DUF2341 domain-containing protein [Prolixibacteraceae bacterium JC049]